jgi:hypothetical protein
VPLLLLATIISHKAAIAIIFCRALAFMSLSCSINLIFFTETKTREQNKHAGQAFSNLEMKKNEGKLLRN